MNRQTILLSALGAVLVLVAFYIFLFQPKQDEIATVRDEIDTTVTLQTAARNEIQRLQAVRANAPRLESQITSAQAVVPTSNSLPGTLRALQMAADDSGVILTSVAPGRPELLEGATVEGLSHLDLSVGFRGSYFQMVDFLRRIEDPAITARGIVWGTGSLTKDDADYPQLVGTVGGSMFAVLEELPNVADADPTPAPTDGETPADGESEAAEEAS